MESKMTSASVPSKTIRKVEPISTEDVTISDSEANHLLSKKSSAITDRLKRKAARTVRLSSNEGASGSEGTSVMSSPKDMKNSRKTRSRYGRGLPKKGGAGGKGTWGKPGSELSHQGVQIDEKDPNYSEGEEYDPVLMELSDDELQKLLVPMFMEYFEHGDTGDTMVSIEELHIREKKSLILVFLITLALEKKPSHREMTSVLISDMYGPILTKHDIQFGFKTLLEKLSDLVLDTPDAAMAVGNFIARAIADDCLPPKFVYTYRGEMECSDARKCLEHADILLKMKHGLVRLDNVWGVGGGMRPVQTLVNQIQLLLKEYISSCDMNEATRCLQVLEVPHFHHAFVYEGILLVIEDSGPKVMESICLLLKSLSESTILSSKQLKIGFEHIYEELPDISIDVPEAYTVLKQFITICDTYGFIPKDLVDSMPVRGRKRFVSEDDGGLIKE